jgi:pimeloyl-ACP methyl ester carboxylesterase
MNNLFQSLATTLLPLILALASPLHADVAPANNFSCTSTTHPNPVVLLHSLGASADLGLPPLQRHLASLGFCTFSLTYGAAWPLLPAVGGVGPVERSAGEVAAFIGRVAAATGRRVDVVGHSEGAVLALHVPREHARARAHVERIVALAPVIHGAEYLGLTKLWYVGGRATRALVDRALKMSGCAACTDLAVGGATARTLADGRPIVAGGNKTTIISSRHDRLVPPPKSLVDEAGVRNVLLQDACPESRAGHYELATDAGA